jgi:uncharacterized protein
VDGPSDLNILRGPRNLIENKNYQLKFLESLEILKSNNIKFGTISVLTKVNASEDKIDRLIEWGIANKSDGRFNQMFVPSHNLSLKKYELTPLELKIAFLKLADAHFSNPKIFKPSVIVEIKNNLLGFGLGCCVYTRCDYLHTRCTTIMGDGNLSRCDRCFEQGYFYSPQSHTTIRSEILGQTECFGCRYFEICGGGCPSEGKNGDFRRKTKFCEAYYAIYNKIEKQIRSILPDIKLSIDVENYYNNYYLKGKSINQNLFSNPEESLQQEKNECNLSQRGQHGDWSNHGDIQHGDSYGTK